MTLNDVYSPFLLPKVDPPHLFEPEIGMETYFIVSDSAMMRIRHLHRKELIERAEVVCPPHAEYLKKLETKESCRVLLGVGNVNLRAAETDALIKDICERFGWEFEKDVGWYYFAGKPAYWISPEKFPEWPRYLTAVLEVSKFWFTENLVFFSFTAPQGTLIKEWNDLERLFLEEVKKGNAFFKYDHIESVNVWQLPETIKYIQENYKNFFTSGGNLRDVGVGSKWLSTRVNEGDIIKHWLRPEMQTEVAMKMS